MSSFPFTSGKLATNSSLGASGQIGKVFEALRLSRGTVQLLISGTVSGNVIIQGSNVIKSSGDVPYSTDNADWVDVDTTSVVSTGSANILANFDTFGARFLRVYFTNTSGTGTADSWFCFKA